MVPWLGYPGPGSESGSWFWIRTPDPLPKGVDPRIQHRSASTLKKTKPWARRHTIRPNHLPGFCLLIVRRLRPPIDVDHQLPQDLGCGVVQPKSSPDGGEVANRVHYFQDPPRRLPVLARCLPQNKNID